MENPEKYAERMNKEAEKAGDAALQAVFNSIDKADDLNDHRKVGTAITAITAAYGSILASALEKGNESQHELAKGMFETMVQPLLEQLYEVESGKTLN